MRSGMIGFLGAQAAGGTDGFYKFVLGLQPLLWLALDEVSGTSAADSSGNGYSSTLIGGAFDTAENFAPPVAGYSGLGKGVRVAEVSDYIETPVDTALVVGTSSASSWTLVVFMTGSVGTNQYVFDRSNSSAVIYNYSTGNVEFFRTGGSGSDPRPGSQIPLPTADAVTPHMIVYRYVNGQWSGFKDGAPIFSVARSFALSPSGSQWYIGGRNTNPCKSGIYDLQLYDRALSDAEIAEMWALRDAQ